MCAWLAIVLAALLAQVPATGGAAESNPAPLSVTTPAAQGRHASRPSPNHLLPRKAAQPGWEVTWDPLDPLSLGQVPAASRFDTGPLRARLLVLPGSALLSSFPQTLSLIPSGPSREARDDTLPEPGDAVSGGFLALELRRGSLGLTLGGGLLRSYAATGGTTAQAPTGAFSLSSLAGSVPAGEPSRGLEPYNRWAAFVAMPYRLSDRMGFTPELSYHHAEDPDQAGNEWVMGLRFSFGF